MASRFLGVPCHLCFGTGPSHVLLRGKELRNNSGKPKASLNAAASSIMKHCLGFFSVFVLFKVDSNSFGGLCIGLGTGDVFHPAGIRGKSGPA